MATWFDSLESLFSQKIIIKRMPGNRIKTLDYSSLQSMGSPTMSNYSRLRRSSIQSMFGGQGTPDIETLEALRLQLYTDYSIMDTDPILSAALDVYADECTARNAQGWMLTVKTENTKVKKVLYNLFYDILNIEFNLWSWVRSTCKYGDFMLYLDITESLGVMSVIPIHPAFLRRRDDAGENKDETVYTYEGPNGRIIGKSDFKEHQIAHFRLLSDTDFIPYGKSMLDGARKVYKQLVLMEDAMLLHRIMRAPERRVFKIDVGNLPPESIDGYIEKISNEMKKIPMYNSDGTYNLQYNLMNMLEDIYLPTRAGEAGTTVETLEGLKNDGAIEDIEYLRDKMMAYLKIPKAFLGYSTLGDVKTSLASEDIRFARTTERIQKIFNSELMKIAMIHLKVQGFSNEDLIDFEISLSPPSMIYERQKIDMLNEKVNLATNLIENKLWSRKRIYTDIFDFNDSEWKDEMDQIAVDLQSEFRFKQIAEEGNDPKVSKTSYGTAHDIASMHMASKFETGTKSDNVKKLYTDDERHENDGRPPKEGSFGRHKDPAYGLDPFGEKETFRKTTNIESYLPKSLRKNTGQLFEAVEDPSEFTNIKMLDDTNIG